MQAPWPLLALLAPAPLPVAAFAGTPTTPPSTGEWVTLFDGQSLDGWVTRGGRYDGNALWTIEEGAIVGREGPNSAGGLLYTEKEYRDFELELDAWITYPFDSGVFLHMVPGDLPPEKGGGKGPQVTLDYRPNGEVGGIYADGYLLHNTAGKEKWKRDEWNRLRVRCIGEPMHISFWLNDELVTDMTVPRSHGPYAKTGRVGLQVHGARQEPEDSVVRFRGIRLRELDRARDGFWREAGGGRLELTDAGRAAGWQSLFDGKSLAGWKGAGDGSGYAVRDGELAFLVDGSSPHLMSEADYRDFDLRLDFKIAKMANSGLFLRAARDGSNPAYSGCEVQILDDFNWETVTNSKLAPYQFSGGLYGAREPGIQEALAPLGEWNTYLVHFRGPRIAVQLNGQLLYDVDTTELEAQPPFAERVKTGFIGLQRHAPAQVEGDAYAWFRNLFVRPIESPAKGD